MADHDAADNAAGVIDADQHVRAGAGSGETEVGDRIVVPGREAEAVGVFAPSVRAAAFGDDGAEVWIGNDVAPGGGRGGIGGDVDDIFPPIGREAADAVEGGKAAARNFFVDCRLGPASAARPKARRGKFRLHAAIQLLGQRSGGVADDKPGNGLHENPVLFRHLLDPADKDSARLVQQILLCAGCNNPHDLFVQRLAVAGLIFVPDHKVGDESLGSPIGVGLDEMLNQVDLRLTGDAKQKNRQIAGDAVAPKAGLALAVSGDSAGRSAQGAIGVKHAVSQSAVELHVGFDSIELPQNHLAVRPGQFKDAIGQARVVIFFREADNRFSGFGDAGDKIDADGFIGSDANGVAKALAAAQKERTAQWRATAGSPGSFDHPA